MTPDTIIRGDKMQAELNPGADGTAADRVIGQIGKCLRKGCVICIEHTPDMAPRFTPWSIWGQASCYNGDERLIHTEIDRCRETHTDHHIRLNIEDFSSHSRFSFMVHSPSAAGS